MAQHRYTEEQLREAIKTSYSVTQVLKKLNVVPAGGNFATIKKYVKMHDIDTSHFIGQGHAKGKKFAPKRGLDEYFDNSFPISSHRLRQRMLSEGYKKHMCERCGLHTWQNEDIPLELHHVDGNRENNSLENIQFLCPNCHALTDNYRARKILSG